MFDTNDDTETPAVAEHEPAAAASKAQESALVRELRAAAHPGIATKMAALDELYARLHPAAGGHRPLTAEELQIQADSELTLEERQLAQQVEHGTYVAVAPIYADGLYHDNGALAYDVGHPVPVTNVERHGYVESGHVRRIKKPS